MKVSLNNPELRASCTKFLSGHKPRTARIWLEELLQSPQVAQRLDRYGEGPVMQTLEQEVAELLGKEAAVFMHKGVIAQQIALRIWADRSGCRNIALHPKSHIDVDEDNAYEWLQNLQGVRLGKDFAPFTLADLKKTHQPLGAVTVELPLRVAGYKLPDWDELVAMSEWTRGKGIAFHIDGARLWESTPYYGKSLAEVAALADSVYVSFYKGLGGMSGCVLAGSKDFIDEAKVWKGRMGGNLFTAFPFVLSAAEGLHYHLPKMPQYYAYACQIAAALSEIPGVSIAPNPPQCNAFQIYLAQDADKLRQSALDIAENDGIWLFGMLEETAVPTMTMGEITVGEATLEWSVEEVVAVIKRMLE